MFFSRQIVYHINGVYVASYKHESTSYRHVRLNNIQSLNGLQVKEPYQGHVNNLTGNMLISRNCILYKSKAMITTKIIITSSPEFFIYSTTDYTNYLYITDHKSKILFVDNDTSLSYNGSTQLYPIIYSDELGFYKISEYVKTYRNSLGKAFNNLGFKKYEKVILTRGMKTTTPMLNLTSSDISGLLIDAREILAGETDYDTLYLVSDSFDDNGEPNNSVSFRVGRIPIFTLEPKS